MKNIASSALVNLKALYGLILITGLLTPSMRGQWLTESFQLTNGWNAIYLNVDASHTTISSLVGSDPAVNPILEVWRWNPASGLQFVDDPQNPIDGASQWSVWRSSDVNPALQRLTGNSAYLVNVGTNVLGYNWRIQGKPVAPVNEWTSTGLNFIGFSTVTSSAPTFEDFLAPAPALQQNAEIYYYRGGDLSTNNPANPARLQGTQGLRSSVVRRGQAYWIRAGDLLNRYFGPFEVDLKSGSIIDFKDNLNSYGIVLRNMTASSISVTVNLISSETPPFGQVSIAGTPALLVRGNLNPLDQTYGYTRLPVSNPITYALPPQGQPGSEVQIVLGINRSVMATNAPGAVFAGILRFTDSLGYLQVDTPVSATTSSTAGLWVGQAMVTQVGQYLKSYQLDSQGNRLVSTNGAYILTGTNTSLAGVPRPFPLRLILHNPDLGGAVMLQRVFVGMDVNTNFVIANKESALNPSLLSQARRISATHLPWSLANQPWTFTGRLSSGASLTSSVLLDYNDRPSNPFIHSYHPDHDNLDATFRNVLAQGAESYSVRRDITLNIAPPADDFVSLISTAQSLGGSYLEAITVSGLPRVGSPNDSQLFQVQGTFSLNRISNLPTLTLVP